MSQRLPSLPNLGHLKKQAKDVLRVSRHRRPSWQLADAQHALARGYGFSSWPDLKRHVESVRRHAGKGADKTVRAPKTPVRDRHSRSRHPLIGTWVARQGRGSERQPQTPLADVVVEFELTDDIVTLTQIAVDRTGRETAAKMTIHADGQDHPIQFGDDLVLQATWRNIRTLDTVVKHGESIVSTGAYEVSADGKSLVVKTPDQVVVFERV